MAIFRCKTNDRFPAMAERQNWKGILNALGEQFGNAHGVGNDAVITQVKEYDALRVEAEFHTSVISYDNHKESGRRITATNNYRTFSDIPGHETLRNVQIILGGTISNHFCTHCGGSGKVRQTMGNSPIKVTCSHCGGTGHYQTFKTVTVSDKTVFYSFCPTEALSAMIRKQNIPTDVLHEGTVQNDKLYSAIGDRLGTEIKEAFREDFDRTYDSVNDRTNSRLEDVTARAECAPLIEIQYNYRDKEYSLYISKQSPSVCCYSKFPGRFLQKIRELFSLGKDKDKDSYSKTDRKLDKSYGSKYQK